MRNGNEETRDLFGFGVERLVLVGHVVDLARPERRLIAIDPVGRVVFVPTAPAEVGPEQPGPIILGAIRREDLTIEEERTSSARLERRVQHPRADRKRWSLNGKNGRLSPWTPPRSSSLGSPAGGRRSAPPGRPRPPRPTLHAASRKPAAGRPACGAPAPGRALAEPERVSIQVAMESWAISASGMRAGGSRRTISTRTSRGMSAGGTRPALQRLHEHVLRRNVGGEQGRRDGRHGPAPFHGVALARHGGGGADADQVASETRRSRTRRTSIATSAP